MASRVRTLPSTDEGVAFWIEYQGIVIYHAGDLNWWHWEGEPKSYNEQMRADYQKRLESFRISRSMLHLCRRISVWVSSMSGDWTILCVIQTRKNVFPMHFWGSYEVFDRLFHEPCTTEYRSRIREIQTEGQVFDIQSQT